MTKKKRYTANEVADAIKTSNGYVSKAADLLQCHVNTVYNYMKEYQTVRDAVTANRESRHDYVENALMQAIKQGNVTAIIFYLKTQAKERGYTEDYNINWRRQIEKAGINPADADRIFEEDVNAMLSLMTGEHADGR